jgi:pimeloyl-ACP methyl ester carboxylesterase
MPLMAATMEQADVAAAVTDSVGGDSGWGFENPDPARWAEPDAMGRLAEITVPALIVVGSDDVWTIA